LDIVDCLETKIDFGLSIIRLEEKNMMKFELPNYEELPGDGVELGPAEKFSKLMRGLKEKFEGKKRTLACFLALTAFSSAQAQEVGVQIESPSSSVGHVIEEVGRRDQVMSEWISSKFDECKRLVENEADVGVMFRAIECTVEANDAYEYFESSTGENLPSSGENISVSSTVHLEDRSNNSFDRASTFSSDFSVSAAEGQNWQNIPIELARDGLVYLTEEDAKINALRAAASYIGVNFSMADGKLSSRTTFETSDDNEFTVHETGLTFTNSAALASHEIKSYNMDIREVRDKDGDIVGYEVVSIQFTI
jgi:hypothetical protein